MNSTISYYFFHLFNIAGPACRQTGRVEKIALVITTPDPDLGSQTIRKETQREIKSLVLFKQ